LAYYAAVRYGINRMVGGFLSNVDGLKRGRKVVLFTDRGVELGELLRTFEGDIPPALDVPMIGEILRQASEEDIVKNEELSAKTKVETKQFAVNKIIELGLGMKIVDVEHVLGGEKIIFFFLAEGRVDFRELVKVLAKKYRSRIEMRQVGVRDEAKLCGDCEYSCGLNLCCAGHLGKLAPITMRMAKNQIKVLDPNRVTGRCGRLRCCLRYEDDSYTELKKDMPLMGSRATYLQHTGDVIERLPLKNSVVLETDERERVEAPVGEITILKPGYEENLDSSSMYGDLQKFRRKSAREDERSLGSKNRPETVTSPGRRKKEQTEKKSEKAEETRNVYPERNTAAIEAGIRTDIPLPKDDTRVIDITALDKKVEGTLDKPAAKENPPRNRQRRRRRRGPRQDRPGTGPNNKG